MDKEEGLYIAIFLIGVLSLAGGLFHSYVAGLIIPSKVIITSYDCVIMIGIIFAFAGLILLFSKRYKIGQKRVIRANVLETIVISILIISFAGIGGYLYGQYQNTLLVTTETHQRMENQLKMMDEMKNNSPFYCKKVIIRDDDIGDSHFAPSLEWLSNLAIKKDIKITFAVIPAILVNNSETIDYLNHLDREHFEFATHGYTHIIFQGIPYEEQYSLIENGTKIMSESLHYKPHTFVPPCGSSDVNTTKVCRVLGYHSITDMLGYPSYVVSFISNFEWEENYHPIKHHSFEDFKSSFDSFCNSSNEHYRIYLHDWTFLDEQGELNETRTSTFERAIDYMKSKNIQFMTIEEAYEWYIDENIIRTGMVNESCYFIDLKECCYNHTIKFNSPSNWDGNTVLRDITTGKETMLYKNVFEFDGTKGHCYEIYEARLGGV